MKKFIPIFFLFVLFFSACSGQREKLLGTWENQNRILSFSQDGQFSLYLKQSTDVKAFSGIYEFVGSPRNAVKMDFLTYLDANSTWDSLQGSEYENFTDLLLFRVDGDKLETKVLSTERIFKYSRVK